MAAASTTKAAQRSRAPYVNLFDLPELMPGAQPSANPAQREDFENRCRQLHRDEERERLDRLQQLHEQNAALAPSQASAGELEAMFPTLDADLVRSIQAEAQTPQDAVDTLLALAMAAEDPEGPAPTSLPPLDVGMDDHDKFPTLTDADGWQVANQRLFDRDPEEDLGSIWRDRAKAAQHMPAPKAAVAGPKPRTGLTKARKEGEKEEELDPAEEFMTDYEFRHRVGQQRAKHRARYGRGAGRGAASARNTPGDAQEEDEDEEEAPLDC
mmetsp:Transcript_46520/g.86975  ORF Transcript_46520/g.86975 Transcript_46520/m.86975 type:complete len:269 (+) Transcript_46520:100-906(+)